MTIQRIRFVPEVTTESATPVLRLVPAIEDRLHSESIYWAPIGAWRGDLFSARVRERVPGKLITNVEGYTIDQRCADPDPESPWLELLTMVSTGPEGGSIEHQEIDYLSDGREFTAFVGWTFTLCGDHGNYPHC